MIIDLPPSLETAITQKVQRNGMATSDYIINLIERHIQSNVNPHDIGEMTAFYYDRQWMDEALNALRVEVPKAEISPPIMYQPITQTGLPM